MGKNELQQQGDYYRVQLENHHHQGRFWGMFHVLDYHHWDNYVKKLLPHKKLAKNSFRCCVAPRTVSFNFVTGEEHLDDESERLLRDHRVKEQDHSLELGPSKDTSNPIIILHGASNPTPKEKLLFHQRFIKARSFPGPSSDSLGTSRLYRSSTMDHKQNEVWLFPKGGEKLKFVTFDSPKDKLVPSKHGWNPFKGFKKKIKRALKETRKEVSTDTKRTDLNKTKIPRMTRLSSLDDDKYIRLFEGTTKLHNSKSLKLTAEDNSKLSGQQKFLRRRLSLPNYEALNSLLAEVPQEKTLSSGPLTRIGSAAEKSKDHPKCMEKDSRTDFSDDPLEGFDADLDAKSPSIGGGDDDGCHCDQSVVEAAEIEKTVTPKAVAELQPSSLVSVLIPVLPAALSFSEDSTTDFDNNLIKGHGGLVKEDDPDFNFVKDILNSAGFYENELIPTWDSIQLPLDPTLFDELEASEDHQLLFDLINEALLEIYERSYTYFPRPFSFRPYTRPVTKGSHVLDEVWKIVKFYKKMRPELDLSLDSIVARQDGWMNHEWDNECLALELEDLILNELVDDLIDVLGYDLHFRRK